MIFTSEKRLFCFSIPTQEPCPAKSFPAQFYLYWNTLLLGYPSDITPDDLWTCEKPFEVCEWMTFLRIPFVEIPSSWWKVLVGLYIHQICVSCQILEFINFDPISQ